MTTDRKQIESQVCEYRNKIQRLEQIQRRHGPLTKDEEACLASWRAYLKDAQQRLQAVMSREE